MIYITPEAQSLFGLFVLAYLSALSYIFIDPNVFNLQLKRDDFKINLDDLSPQNVSS